MQAGSPDWVLGGKGEPKVKNKLNAHAPVAQDEECRVCWSKGTLTSQVSLTCGRSCPVALNIQLNSDTKCACQVLARGLVTSVGGFSI